MAYSEDLRKKVVEYLESGHTQRDARDIFCIDLSTINRWHVLYITTGSLKDIPAVHKPKKLPREQLLDYITAHPDAYLKEIAADFGCSDTAVSKALARYGITRKKKRYDTVNKIQNK